jgi:hypothetical protein
MARAPGGEKAAWRREKHRAGTAKTPCGDGKNAVFARCGAVADRGQMV